MTCALAANFTLEEGGILVNGPLRGEDAVLFDNLLEQNPAIHTVAFGKSLGGNVAGLFGFAKAIKKRRLNTMVRGQCFSACAFAFLAGTKRTFEQGGFANRTLLFHLSRRADGAPSMDASADDLIMKHLNEVTEGQLDSKIVKLISSVNTESSGVVFVQRSIGPFNFIDTYFCDQTKKRIDESCEKLSRQDLFAQNILRK